MRMIVQWAIVGLIFLIASCGAPDPVVTRPITPDLGEAVVVGCMIGEGGKADRRCDLGVRNPVVVPETIRDTICRPDWADTVRPPPSYTGPLKRLDMARYGLRGEIDEYRFDALIPVELGGSPTNTDNLWPQPIEDSYRKNADAGKLRDQVCAGTLGLHAAQDKILADWSHDGAAAP